MPLSELFLIILMGAASVLCIAAVFFLNRITKSLNILTDNVTDMKIQLVPVIQNVIEMTEKVNSTTDDLKGPINDIIYIIAELKEKLSIAFEYEEKLRTTITSNVSGVFKGIKTFWNSYKHNGRSSTAYYQHK